MNDLPRLKMTSNHAACRLLLESALEDHSASGAAERALQALNLGAAAAAAASAGAAHAGTSSSAASHFVGSIVIKWLGLGLLAGVTTLVSAEQAVRKLSEPQPVPATVSHRIGRSTAPPSIPHVERVTAAPPAASESQSRALPASTTARHAEAFAASAPDLPSSPTSDLVADPVQDLRTIRRALAEHAPARALALLNEFVTHYPTSTLLEEAAVLRFDAWLALDSAQARAAGEAFLRRYPRSAYAERVQLKLLSLP